MCFLVANCQHGDQNQLVRRLTFDTDIDSAHGQPARYLARPTNIDDSLEYIRWIHGLWRESLPATSYGILPNQKKVVFLPFETDGDILSSVLCKPADILFFLHAPGQLPPHDTDHGVKTVTLGWVRAPNERTPFSIHDAILVLLIDVCRGLGISPLRTEDRPEVCSIRCW